MRRNLFDDFAVLFFRFIGDYFRVRAGEVSNSIQKKQNKIAADLEKGFGVYMADRNTVNLSERMKVTVCLNPVHSATGPLGVVLGYDLFAHMLNTNEDMMKMARMVAYDEGLPVVADPGILSPQAFVDELFNDRFPMDTNDSVKHSIYDITTFGEILIDFTSQNLNEDGQMLYARNPGGAPANVAVAASRLGAHTAFSGKAGKYVLCSKTSEE